MSHFTVLVIGDDPQGQLAPFSEEINVPEYVSCQVGEGEKLMFLEHYIKEKNLSPELTFDEVYVLYGEDWNGNKWRKDENGIWQEYSTYNPNYKWDWYQLGGRWRGYFQLKPGADGELGSPGVFDNAPMNSGNVDQARKCDIDFEAMRDEAGKKAADYYDRFYKIVGDQPLPNWNEIRERHGKENIDNARAEYREHPVVKLLNQSKEFEHEFMFRDIMEMAESRGDYIEKARRSRAVTFAVLYNGKWYEKGEMGWFGMVSNEKDQNEWNDQFYELLESLPDDTLLSVYDCHI
jgi:hypothetical protein